MKNTPKASPLPTQEWHLLSTGQVFPSTERVPEIESDYALEDSSYHVEKAKSRREKGTGRQDFSETEDSKQEDTFRIYLNEIGSTGLLSPEEERELGRRIRTGLNALLQHLLASGWVGEVLLEQTRTEMARKKCSPAHKSALSSALKRAEAVLFSAREKFDLGADRTTGGHAEVAAVFAELVSVMGLCPDRGLDLLALLEEEWSNVCKNTAANPESAAPSQFVRRNLMGPDTCESFLAEGRRLRAAALTARNQMVAANLRLVVSVAKKMPMAFLSLEDLVQEGNFGLVKAAERFDERLGHRFSTFAVRLIKTAMRRENDNQGRTIRLPVHRCEALRKLEEARRRIEAETQEPASVGQLSAETGFSDDEVRELTLLKQAPVSLQQETGDAGGLTLEALLPDPDSLTPYDGENETDSGMDSYLQHLGETQRTVVACLYGIGSMPQLTLEETADVLELTHAQVRTLHQGALVLLRNLIASRAGTARFAHAA